MTAVNKAVFGSRVLIDLTSDTVSPEYLLRGYTAHDKSGNVITGTLFDGLPSTLSVTDDLETQSGYAITDNDGEVIQSQTVYAKQ